MSRRKQHTIKEARHVRIYHAMMQTPAWRALSPKGRAAYVEMSMRYGGPGSNNGRIPYSSRELEQNLKVGRKTALRTFAELQSHGFIVMTKKGRYGAKRSYASEWRLTEFACDLTGAQPTHDYRQWQGPAKPVAVKDFEHRLRATA
jgi:hypothetical protein